MIEKKQSDTEKLFNFIELANIAHILQKTIKAKITLDTNQEKDNLSDLEITHFVDNYFSKNDIDGSLNDHHKELLERLNLAQTLFVEQYSEYPSVHFDKDGANVLMLYYLVYICSKKHNIKKDKFSLEKFHNKNHPIFLKLCEEYGVTGKNFYWKP